ncbi:hypothetical protein HYY75_06255 [bacterium]|nr:hypothetical protein [bacterium]
MSIKNPRLTGRLIPAESRTAKMEEQMFRLMETHFQPIDREKFLADLKEKDKIILLEDLDGNIQGFTTIKILVTTFENEPIRVIFSGDTIIHRNFWGTLELPRTWGRFMLSSIREAQGIPLFWFLISSGYKTYRFLPVFFREFFPRFNVPTPKKMECLIEHLANVLFPDQFDKMKGTIALKFPTPLRPGIADLTPDRMKDPHISFFAQRNPDHYLGVELACLAPLEIGNLQPFVKRLLRTAEEEE